MEKASLLEAVFEVLGLANLLYFILAIFGIHTGAAKKTVPAAKKTVPAAKETVPAAKETVPAANSGSRRSRRRCPAPSRRSATTRQPSCPSPTP